MKGRENQTSENNAAMPPPLSGNAGPLVLLPGQGRAYECGPMRAVFKVDRVETGGRYSVSEWTVACSGPHAHDESDEIFLVTDGTMAVRIGDVWVEAPRGTFLHIPARVIHDFENRSDRPATLFNVFTPGEFEHLMPSIVEWFSRPSAPEPRTNLTANQHVASNAAMRPPSA